MARIRTIKPDFWKNETLGEMGSDAQLLFIGLWNLCDRRGFVEYRPKRIKAELFPYRDFDIDEVLNSLKSEFIEIIAFDNKHYIHVINFNKHQVINVKEPESIVPEQYWHSTGTVPAQCQTSTGTWGKEGKGKEGSNTRAESFSDNEIIDVLKNVTEELLTEEQKTKRFNAVARELKNSTAWHEAVAIALGKTPDDIKTMIPVFLNVIKADSDYFKTLKNIQGHFRNWAKLNGNSVVRKDFEPHIPLS